MSARCPTTAVTPKIDPAYVARLVDSAPQISHEQRARLSAVLNAPKRADAA